MIKRALVLRRQTVRPLSHALLGSPRGGIMYTTIQEGTDSRANCGGGESENCQEGGDVLSFKICKEEFLTLACPTQVC